MAACQIVPKWKFYCGLGIVISKLCFVVINILLKMLIMDNVRLDSSKLYFVVLLQ